MWKQQWCPDSIGSDGVIAGPSVACDEAVLLAWDSPQGEVLVLYNPNEEANEEPNRDDLLEQGTLGRIRGLLSRVDLNGKMGQVLWHVGETGRYKVRVRGEKDLAVKPANLEPVQEAPSLNP